MKKRISIAAGHAICLAVLLMLCSIAVIVTKAFLPATILPRITITVLVALSLAAQVAELWIFGSKGHPEYLETGLLAMAAFGVMTWAVGLATLPGAGQVGIVGGITYTVCLIMFDAIRARLENSSVAHKKAVLTLAAALVLLACQSLAGIPVLT
ncbi:MAG TPA: hypothetical protein IAC31_02065 [Candidatus Faecousia intestinigallinarum]|nr:hypothetical protein [Candidatus Faecousia intestinigallinarum]